MRQTGKPATSPDRVGSSFVYIEQGASRLVDAALAAAHVSQKALQLEGESLVLSSRAGLARVMLARSADVGPGFLTFVAAQESSDELRQQLYALVQVLTEEFPRASVRIRFVSHEDETRGSPPD